MSELRQTDAQEENGGALARLNELIAPAAVQFGDAVSGRIIGFDHTPSDMSIQVTKLSPLGIEFTVPGEKHLLVKGSTLDLMLSIGGHSQLYRGLIVDRHAVEHLQQRITVRLVQPGEQRKDGEERRSTTRWMCSEQFVPTGIAANPARYNDYVYFTIRDVSRAGARLVTSLRNKFIVTGMRLSCIVSFPLVAQMHLEIEVKNVSVANDRGKDVLSVGVEFPSIKEADLSVIAQYLIQFGDTQSLEVLRSEGLIPVSMGKAVDYSFVRTKEEYDEVLQLRWEAYGDAGKIRADISQADMADPYDANSRIVIGKYKGRIVVSARLYFPQYGDVLEQEEFVTWPPSFGRRDECMEIMRICTHTDFRRSDLLFSFFRFVAITAMQAKRYKVVGCATDALLPLYTKIGFKSTGLTYNLPLMNDLRHTVIMGDAKRGLVGLDVGPLAWNVVWRETVPYLVENGYLAIDAPSQLRLMIYRAFGPLAYMLQRRARRPRRVRR
jgi:hypothetical protein